MQLLAQGRDADVFEVDEHRVLRRYRRARDTAREARIMRYVRDHGFPVPEVYDADGADLVMERVGGRTMLAELSTRPHRLRAQGRLLADLHRRLHAVPAPEWVDAPFGEGDALVHLDLHPDNVILTADGPVVIDWTNARRGDPAIDVAFTWLILASAPIPGSRTRAAVLGAFRNAFVASFLAGVDRAGAAARLAYVAELRSLDPNVTDDERTQIAAFRQRHAS